MTIKKENGHKTTWIFKKTGQMKIGVKVLIEIRERNLSDIKCPLIAR